MWDCAAATPSSALRALPAGPDFSETKLFVVMAVAPGDANGARPAPGEALPAIMCMGYEARLHSRGRVRAWRGFTPPSSLELSGDAVLSSSASPRLATGARRLYVTI